ncbi:uncharacterized protein LOC6734360 [Drosophila simulans]|uniref:GD10985 n=1 Tax=Drosophila simulans TaxID=7240 RepID=B4QEH6_DROSI|nr:uncharacterized protein LOC6734360 [Drosophila simulans]EDX06966.1 GD10985 [Drosophila simulans]KMY93568.1 uncharacterized protein Dsimw501_GD10985 [Drosophila simulans]
MAETTGVQIKLEQQNIKERLNLHVKRRLQQDADNPAESPELLPTDANAKRSKTKDVSKPRKPYQKRTEKPKTETTKCKKVGQLGSPAGEVDPMDDQETEGFSPEAPDGKSARRDCCKNADILNIVLNAKKRILMQDPEVQAFWTEITNCIKG